MLIFSLNVLVALAKNDYILAPPQTVVNLFIKYHVYKVNWHPYGSEALYRRKMSTSVKLILCLHYVHHAQSGLN